MCKTSQCSKRRHTDLNSQPYNNTTPRYKVPEVLSLVYTQTNEYERARGNNLLKYIN